MMTEPPPETAEPIDCAPCGICGRTFNPDVLARHSRVCEKQQEAASKRKMFDSSKQRAMGTDLESFMRHRGGRPSTSEQKAAVLAARRKGAWKRKHDDFIESIRSARVVIDPHSGAALSPRKPAPPNPDYVQCPHCERRFQDATAERHIPFCKEQSDRIERTPLSSKAKNSLSKRKQYKPPTLKKRTSISGTRGEASTNPPPAGASVVLKNTNFSHTYTIADNSGKPPQPTNPYRDHDSNMTSGVQNRVARTNATGIPRAVKPGGGGGGGGGPLTKAAFPKHSSPLRNPLGNAAAPSDRRQSHGTFQHDSRAASETASNARPPLRQTSFSKRSAGRGGGGGVISKRGGIRAEDDFSESDRSPIHAKTSIRSSPLQNGRSTVDDKRSVPAHSRHNHSRKTHNVTTAYEYSSDEHLMSPSGHSSQATNGVFHSKRAASNAQMRLTSIGGSDHSLSSASEEDLAVMDQQQHPQTHTLTALRTKPGLLQKLGSAEGSLEKLPSRPSAQEGEGLDHALSSESLHRYNTSSGSSLAGGGRGRGHPLNAHGMTMSKFCYECGFKFPIPQAKYCCECGTKRI